MHSIYGLIITCDRNRYIKSTTLILMSWPCAKMFVLVLWSHFGQQNKKDHSFRTVITLTHPQIVQCCPFLRVTMSIRSVPDRHSRQQAPLQELEPCWFLAAGTKSDLFMTVHCGALVLLASGFCFEAH